MLISCTDSTVKHYGSCCSCPTDAYVDVTTQNFIKINSIPITTTSNTLTVPTHTAPDCLSSHDHPNLPIDVLHQNYVKVNGYVVCVVGDKNSGEDTRIETAGTNTFVSINF
jgi:hypothetical protein